MDGRCTVSTEITHTHQHMESELDFLDFLEYVHTLFTLLVCPLSGRVTRAGRGFGGCGPPPEGNCDTSDTVLG